MGQLKTPTFDSRPMSVPPGRLLTPFLIESKYSERQRARKRMTNDITSSSSEGSNSETNQRKVMFLQFKRCFETSTSDEKRKNFPL